MAADNETPAKHGTAKGRASKPAPSAKERGGMPPKPGKRTGRPIGSKTVIRKPTIAEVEEHERRGPGDPLVHPRLRYRDDPKTQGSIDAFIPTDDHRRAVMDYKLINLTNKEIAFLMRISITCLEKHFMAELVRAVPTTNSQIAASVARRAMNGDQKAAEFWLRTQAGWRNAEADDKDNGVKTITVVGGLD